MNLLIVLGAMFGIAGSLFLPIRKMLYLVYLNKSIGEYRGSITHNTAWSHIFFEFLAFGQIAVGFMYEVISQFESSISFPPWLIILALIVLLLVWWYGFSTEALNDVRITASNRTKNKTYERRIPEIKVEFRRYLALLFVIAAILTLAVFLGNKEIVLSQSTFNYIYPIIIFGILPMGIVLIVDIVAPLLFNKFILSMYPDFKG